MYLYSLPMATVNYDDDDDDDDDGYTLLVYKLLTRYQCECVWV